MLNCIFWYVIYWKRKETCLLSSYFLRMILYTVCVCVCVCVCIHTYTHKGCWYKSTDSNETVFVCLTSATSAIDLLTLLIIITITLPLMLLIIFTLYNGSFTLFNSVVMIIVRRDSARKYNASTVCSTCNHNIPAFCLVEGPEDGLIQSETCSQSEQKKNISYVLTGDLWSSFITNLNCFSTHFPAVGALPSSCVATPCSVEPSAPLRHVHSNLAHCLAFKKNPDTLTF